MWLLFGYNSDLVVLNFWFVGIIENSGSLAILTIVVITKNKGTDSMFSLMW